MGDIDSKEFDLHGHTKFSAFNEFVNYTPEEAIKKAKEVGLDGIAITGHDTLQGLDEALNIAARDGVIVVPGVEISSRIGFRIPHILALGVTPEEVKRNKYPIPRFKSPDTVITWIHDHGGIAIAAHPSEEGKLTQLSYEEVKRFAGMIEGIEVVTTLGHNEAMAKLADEKKLAGLGSSDFHMLSQIGLVGTRVFGKVETYQDVIQSIREKKVEAFIRTDIPEELRGGRSPDILLRQWRGEKL
jgi:predicted metal-dependent phosphoesterase TrpH